MTKISISKKFGITSSIFKKIWKVQPAVDRRDRENTVISNMTGSLKLRYPQTHVPIELMRERLKLAQVYVLLTRTFSEMAFPQRSKSYGSDLEALLVLICVFIGDAEGRPTTVTKIASHAGLPRATVYRRLEQLCELKKIVRVKRSYFLAPGAASPDDHGRLAKILRGFIGN